MKQTEIVGILLDIRSLYNTASMFRTADGAGLDALYLSGYTPEPFDRFKKLRREFDKVALGAQKHVRWESVEDAYALIDRLHADDFFILAVEQRPGSTPLHRVHDLTQEKQKQAFIVGNEVDGISEEICKKVDAVVEIPMIGGKESLNASVAFGVVAYWLRLAR